MSRNVYAERILLTKHIRCRCYRIFSRNWSSSFCFSLKEKVSVCNSAPTNPAGNQKIIFSKYPNWLTQRRVGLRADPTAHSLALKNRYCTVYNYILYIGELIKLKPPMFNKFICIRVASRQRGVKCFEYLVKTKLFAKLC